MTTNAMAEMSKDTQEKLAKAILTEAMWMAFRTLVELIGSEGAINETRPHFRNAGHAFALNMTEMFRFQGNDIETIDEVIGLFEGITEMNPKEAEHTQVRIVKIGGPDCSYCGAPQEACIIAHEVMCQAICEQINPDFTCRFTQMVTKGDPICSWVIEKKKK